MTQEELNEALINACFGNDLEDVIKFTNQGADVNTTSYNKGWTLLHTVAEEGTLDIAQFLIGKGANVNKVNHYGETPLHIATDEGKLAIAKLLIENGANVNLVDSNADTPSTRGCKER